MGDASLLSDNTEEERLVSVLVLSNLGEIVMSPSPLACLIIPEQCCVSVSLRSDGSRFNTYRGAESINYQ